MHSRTGSPGIWPYALTTKPDPRPKWNPALYNFTPADQFDIGGLNAVRAASTLSPKSRFVNAINTIPIPPGVPHETVVGDNRGLGDSPNSSDQNPQAIAEVLHILNQYAGR